MMNIKIGIWLWCLVCCCSVSAQTTTLYGCVTDAENGEPILFGSVAIYQDGTLITGVETDFDGNYVVDDLEVGIYDVEASYIGYKRESLKSIEIVKDEKRELNIVFVEAIPLMCICQPSYQIPLIEQDNNTQGQIITSDRLRNRGRGY